MTIPARVLLVDDERSVLDGLRRTLRGSFDVHAESDPVAAVARLRTESFSAIVSDMQMPKMSGIELLRESKMVAPHTTRVLLTGHADLASAMAAINEGAIFRFVCKPCAPADFRAVLEHACEYHLLVVAEKELLEQTLRGAVEALVDTLALAAPAAFGRAVRARRLGAALASQLGLPVWEVELATMLGALGDVTLPAIVQDKVGRGLPLTPVEAAMLKKTPEVVDGVLSRIPRIDRIRDILRLRHGRAPLAAASEDLVLAAKVIGLVHDFECLRESCPTTLDAVKRLERSAVHAPDLLDKLAAIASRGDVRRAAVGALHVGLVLANDLHLANGVLLVARGQQVTEGMLARLLNFRDELPATVDVYALDEEMAASAA